MLTTKSLGLNVTKTILIMCLVSVILLSSGFLASAASNKSAPSKTRLDVYSDSACKREITSIDWGSFMVGESISKTVYIKNTGTTQLTLHLEKTELSPSSVSNTFSLVWDSEDIVIKPNQKITATLTLTTTGDFNASTDFDMNVIITGTT